MTGMEYDHVVVAAWGDDTYGAIWGMEGSVESSFTAGQALEYGYVADISDNMLIQDKARLKAIALLVDNSSLVVVNAAQTTIKDYATAVEGVRQGAVGEAARYNLLGQRTTAQHRGLHIQRMSDGSVRKVVNR